MLPVLDQLRAAWFQNSPVPVVSFPTTSRLSSLARDSLLSTLHPGSTILCPVGSNPLFYVIMLGRLSWLQNFFFNLAHPFLKFKPHDCFITSLPLSFAIWYIPLFGEGWHLKFFIAFLLTQGSNLHLLHLLNWKVGPLPLCHLGSPLLHPNPYWNWNFLHIISCLITAWSTA